MTSSQILTAEQMRAAEQALFDAGMSVSELMEVAAGGAAEWVRRIAAGRSVTVLCGPGNNGGDGYVIARRLKEAGSAVQVVAPLEPKTEAARAARKAWAGPVLTSGGAAQGEVFVDCLFGTGLARPLSGEHALLLRVLADRHAISIAVDLPSGIDSDTGALLTKGLPHFEVTLALGAWKFAHWSLPGRELMGAKRLVPIGIEPVADAAQLLNRPLINAPPSNSHKYVRGLAAIVAGAMPGASHLAAEAAMRAGAGYVKLVGVSDPATTSNPALVAETAPLDQALSDSRIASLLIGPGLGRDSEAQARLKHSMAIECPVVLDADALMILRADMLQGKASILATPHDGELEALCREFSVIAEGRLSKAKALARAAQFVVLAKGPDTYVAAPDGRVVVAPAAPSWLSTAGSGDVLAGIAVSRMATGRDPFEAASEAVWLHGEAARSLGPAFTPIELAQAVSKALERCL